VWAEVVPLYRSPSLTDEEREAIEDAAHLCESSPYPLTQKDGATLRNLLRRTTL
jgi:hypothetical protein